MKTTTCLKALPVDLAHRLASTKATRVSLKQMYTMGRKLLDSQDTSAFVPFASFLHSELPVRLTQSAALLDAVFPKGMDHSHRRPPVLDQVAQLYVEDIQTLTSLPQPDSIATEQRFTEVLRHIASRQHRCMAAIGRATNYLSELERTGENRRLQLFFDRFYSANFGTHLLISEHLTLRDHHRHLVDTIQPYEVAQQAVSDARRACMTYFGQAPEVQLISQDTSIKTTYIREHLRHIIFETVSFSLRSTMNQRLNMNKVLPLPPIQLVMVNGGEDVTFKVSDQAGGMPARRIDRLWCYTQEDEARTRPTLDTSHDMSSTANKTTAYPVSSLRCPFSTSTRTATELVGLPGFGFGRGLPVARLAARYFGGDLDLVSMEGHGTDIYTHLARTGTQLENFPISTDITETVDPNHWVMPPRIQEA